jgi:hypothetical protein
MTSTLTREGIDDHRTGRCPICVLDVKAPGPAVIKPMIQLRSIMDAGTPMTVTAADYADPERWWL